MALVRPKGLLLHGETASFDAASSQSNQRSFHYVWEGRRWRKAIAVSGQIFLIFHGGVFACNAVAR